MIQLHKYNLRGKIDPDAQRQIQNIVQVVEAMQSANGSSGDITTVKGAAVGSLFTQAQLKELTGLFGAFAQAPIGTTTQDPLLQGVPTGNGTVTSFSSGNLSPLFNTGVATSTSTPTQTFSQINQNANVVFAGPATGAAAAPTFRALTAADFQVAAVTLLASTPLNLNTNTKQTLYAVPAGSSAVPIAVGLRSASVDLSGGATTNLSFGFNAGATDWSNGAAIGFTQLTASSLFLCYSQQESNAGNPATIGTAAQVFGALCDIAFGSAATVQADVFGYLF